MSDQTPQYSQPPQPEPKRKSWPARHKILTTLGVLLLLGAIFGGGASGGGTDTPAADTNSTPAAADTPTEATPAAEDTPTEATPAAEDTPTKATAPAMTSGQENALNKAKDYLDYDSFSLKGLIKQLKYEGYSTADATFAAKRVGADWDVQAAKKAKDYLDYDSFSHSGLVRQLMYDGFTRAQAEYGTRKAGL